MSAYALVEQRSSAAPIRTGIVFSQGIRAIAHLKQLTGLTTLCTPAEAARQGIPGDVVLVWGRKGSAQRALKHAKQQSIPVWFLEDGWIRTASKDAHGRLTYSLLVDRQGVYYDSAEPSELETYLNRSDAEFRTDCDDAALAYARANRTFLVDQEITKYNFCRQGSVLPVADERPLVLVIDQTRDDASVRHGGMDAAGFRQMLEAAAQENPEARIVVRTHPDVLAGRRAGYLTEAARRLEVAVEGGGDNPFSWLKRASRVYAGTSQLGYEALLAGCDVTLFGQPFYAGWGLTDDRNPVSRRTAIRSIDELFHATHVKLAHYCSPMTGERWQLHDCLEHVALQKRQFARNARRFHAMGITPWKRRYVRQFLRSPDGSVVFSNAAASAKADTLVTWGFRRFADASTSIELPVWRLEDGFLRSAGLGSNFTAPGSLVIDTRGLYFDPGAPSDLETLLNHHDCKPADIARAGQLRAQILQAGVSKYNVGERGHFAERPSDRCCVVVSGQVEDDESIRRGCSEVTTNAALIQAVRKARPEAWIIYRPHPDVHEGNRRGAVDPFTLQSCVDEIDVGSSVIDCIDACDEWHTMTSLSGFEALLRKRKVVTYGAPFYAGWGLTEDHRVVARRGRVRTLDELVYLALIVYPVYVDIDSGEFVRAEDMVSIMERQGQQLEAVSETPWGSGTWNKIANIVRGLRYAP